MLDTLFKSNISRIFCVEMSRCVTEESLEALDTFEGIKLVSREVQKRQRREVLESGNGVGRGELVVGEDQLVEVDTGGDVLDMIDLLLGHVEFLELLEVDSCSLGRDNGGRQLHLWLLSCVVGRGMCCRAKVFLFTRSFKKKKKRERLEFLNVYIS